MEKTCYNCGSPISKETCEDFPEVCEHWSLKKPLTNADRIRAMTNKELAEYLFERGNEQEYCYGICTYQDECEEIHTREFCIQKIIDWLQKEAEHD